MRLALTVLAVILGGFLWQPSQAAPLPQLEALFSPEDDIEGRLHALMRKARQSLHVEAYVLTSRSLARGLIEAAKRGVEVAVLADAAQAANNPNSQLQSLVNAGVRVALVNRYAAFHSKVLLVDVTGGQPVVVTGSYNWSYSAQYRNSENVLIVTGDRLVAARYLTNWQRRSALAQPLPGRDAR